MAKGRIEDYFEHSNADYPVGIYYVDMSRMFMQRVRPQWHEAMEIDLIRSGSAEFSVGDARFTARAGEAVWINQSRLHAIRPADEDGECVILSILFSPSYLFEKADSFLAIKYYRPLTSQDSAPCMLLDRGDDFGQSALKSVDEILNANLNKEYGYELKSKSLLCTLWLKLLEKGAHLGEVSLHSLTDEQRVKDAMEFIHRHYDEDISLQDIAASISVSKSECCRAFKRGTEATPFDYLLTHRIFESARLLQRGDKKAASMQKLSAAVGFGSASYYNRIFKKYLGLTPGEYKEQIRTSHRDALSPYGISLARL